MTLLEKWTIAALSLGIVNFVANLYLVNRISEIEKVVNGLASFLGKIFNRLDNLEHKEKPQYEPGRPHDYLKP